MITDKEKISEITKTIMLSLPKWFSPPEDIIKKSIIHRDYPFFVAYDNDLPIGFAALKIHNKYTVDIFNIGVLEEYHRRKAGHLLIEEIEKYCKNNRYIYLTVKTLDESAEYEPYNSTRAFYLKEGFIPLEIFKTFWNEENPCLFLVKRIE